MEQRDPTITTVDRNDIRQQTEELLRRVAAGETRVNVDEEGRTVAAIVSGRDLDRLRRFDREVADGSAILERMRRPFRDVDPEQVERDVAELIEE